MCQYAKTYGTDIRNFAFKIIGQLKKIFKSAVELSMPTGIL